VLVEAEEHRVDEAKINGHPISPITAIGRGTSPDLYIRYASSRVFDPIAKPRPNRNVQSWIATAPLRW
jgi:hypothetical protein